jgi:hypothetical protein
MFKVNRWFIIVANGFIAQHGFNTPPLAAALKKRYE